MKQHIPLIALSLIGLFAASVQAQSTVPNRQIPPSVLTELRLLEQRFEQALSQDCAPERCFPKGCTYGAHRVADRPTSSSLPGLGEEVGPGSVPPQEYLTLAHCSFAHERSIKTRNAQSLVKRLQSKLSKGWTVVEVSRQLLQPIPDYLREAPPKPEPQEEPTVEAPEELEEELPETLAPTEWESQIALRELWNALLPHFSWMIALLLLTLAALVIIWAIRRLGRISPEEQALMTQLLQNPDESGERPPSASEQTEAIDHQEAGAPEDSLTENSSAFVTEQTQLWNQRLESIDNPQTDTGLQDLISELLRNREMAILAKAVLQFPQQFPQAFPEGGELAAVKLELADYLKGLKPHDLPTDEEFFEQLNRHSLSASLSSQSDAQIARTLREEFGAAGITQLANSLPPRHGALLFALTPLEDQYEVARLFSQGELKKTAQQLLLSNRMDKQEITYLFDVLAAVKNAQQLPAAPADLAISDRGHQFDATSALSILLPHLEEHDRAGVFQAAVNRFNGEFPFWYNGILYPQMLLKLSNEARANLFLEIEIKSLAGWLSMQTAESQNQLIEGLPNSLQAAINASLDFASRSQQLALARVGREKLSLAMRMELTRNNIPLQHVVM